MGGKSDVKNSNAHEQWVVHHTDKPGSWEVCFIAEWIQSFPVIATFLTRIQPGITFYVTLPYFPPPHCWLSYNGQITLTETVDMPDK